MKIKRFFATDMRNAIRQVRETLGPDAVILSNRSINGGVELMAALDFNEQAFAPQDETDGTDYNRAVTPPYQGVETEEDGAISQDGEGQGQPGVEWSQDPTLVAMRKEMHALRQMMENELSELTWREMGKRRPNRQELLRRLMSLDLSPDICLRMVEKVGDIASVNQGWRLALHHLTQEINTVGDLVLEQGGVIAVVGPTGAGKTTSVAKLAARFALRYGHRHVALITTDNYRVGAQEQLTTYARILDVPIRSVSDEKELNIALNALAEKRLVLIDTAGMSQRDVRISEQLSMLRAGSRPVTCFLALSATTQQASLEQAIQAFSKAHPKACILTKLDEAVSLGGVFSAILNSNLPFAYFTDGQQVPEDIHIARAHTLTNHAANMGHWKRSGEHEGLLALALGGASAHAHG